MIVSNQGIYLRCETVQAGTEVLSGADLAGVVLPGRWGWCEVLLPPQAPLEPSLRRLARQGCGVLRFQHNDYGHDILFLRGDRSLRLDPVDLGPWISLGLVQAGVPAQIAKVGVQAISWLRVLKLPPPLHHAQEVWRQSYVPVRGARVVGLSMEVEGEQAVPAALGGERLIEMLVANQVLALTNKGSLVPDFCAAWEQGESAEALMALLLAHPGVEELYLSDAAWVQAVAAARAQD